MGDYDIDNSNEPQKHVDRSVKAIGELISWLKIPLLDGLRLPTNIFLSYVAPHLIMDGH